MVELYQWTIDLLDRVSEDICAVFERVLAVLFGVAGLLFALLTLATLFG